MEGGLKMGLDVYLYKCNKENIEEELAKEDPELQLIEFPSAKYPDHFFKIGYFRSSYSEGGINAFLRRRGIPDLYYIFDVDSEQYYVRPDWLGAKLRVKEVKKLLEEQLEGFPYDVTVVSPSSAVSSEREALQFFKEEIEKNSSFSRYSNKRGFFSFREPLEVVGVMMGVRWGMNCAYLIYKQHADPFYLQALEIVEETINFVLSTETPEKYLLGWSA